MPCIAMKARERADGFKSKGFKEREEKKKNTIILEKIKEITKEIELC